MKKSDLKTGMRLIDSGGIVYIFIQTDTGGNVVREGWGTNIDSFSEDFTYGQIKIVKIAHGYQHDCFLQISNIGNVIWNRKEEKTIVTIDGVDYTESELRTIISNN